MTIRAKLEWLGALLTLCGLAVVVPSWNESRKDRLQMQSVLDSQKQIIAEAQAQIRALQEADKVRDKATQSAVAEMHHAAAQTQTPLQIVKWLPTQLDTPSPIRFSVPAPTASNPTPDAMASIPQQDLPSLRDLLESCKECKVELNAAQQDLASKNQQLRLAGEQLSATERQRDAAVTAAKGGTFWHRVGRNTHWLLVGAGAGAAALCATRHCR